MSEGYISLHRKILEWEWFHDINVLVVFIYLLLKANHKDNKWRGKTVKRGQLITSYSHIATDIGQLSIHQVRIAINKLKSTGELTSKTNNKYTVITINNYCKYQTGGKQVPNLVASKRQASGKQVATNNNDNNENNENKYIELTHENLKTIASSLKVPLSVVKDTYDSVLDYEQGSRGKPYLDRAATVRNWIRRDLKEGKLKREEIIEL